MTGLKSLLRHAAFLFGKDKLFNLSYFLSLMKILKVPCSAGGLGKGSGAELAPDKIVECMKQFYLSEQGVFPNYAVDAVAIDQSNIQASMQAIHDKVQQLKQNFILLGGDHSVTHPAFKAFASQFKNAGMIVFDAHPDCMQPFSAPTHENFLRTLIEEGIVKPENVVLVGIRNWDKEEYRFLQEKNIKYYPMKALASEGLQTICDAVMAAAKDWEALYLSIDVDAVDAAFVPGTGYPEVGGLTSRELLYFVHRIKHLKNLKAADIVEVNPPKDIADMTARLAAKLAIELL